VSRDEQRVPFSVMTVSRDELGEVSGENPHGEPLELEVLDSKREHVLGRLHGHLFIVAPVGNVHDRANTPRTSLLNGDGMVYRVDLAHTRAEVTSRIVKPACYWADRALEPIGAWRGKINSFSNQGISRTTLELGFRNFGNTALLPMFDEKSGAARLLVTYDAGRPMEIDPVTLQTLTPVGAQKEWTSELDFKSTPFKLILSSAHPVWDATRGELFTVNYGRSVNSLLGAKAEVSEGLLGNVPDFGHPLLDSLLEWIETTPSVFKTLSSLIHKTGKALFHSVKKLLPWLPEDFVKLVRWDGQGALTRWDVVIRDENGSQEPLRIQDSMHQVAVTRDYVILADTNYKVGVNQWLYNPRPEIPTLDRFVRLMLARPQLGQLALYIIPRAELTAGTSTVVARRVILPFGAVHFLVDFDNPDKQITLHAGHGSALDIAEWVRTYDRAAWGPGAPPTELSGMLTNSADVGRLGRYVIDAETGNVISARTLADEGALWSLGLYAAENVPAWQRLPDRIRDIYWFTSGFRGEMMTRFILNLYRDYPDRLTTLSRLQELCEENSSRSSLFRVDAESLTIKDCYEPEGFAMFSSPQIIPARSGGPEGGLLIVTEFRGEDASSLLIFDARDLASGPIARLSSPKLRLGLTLHTAWLPHIERSTAGYYVDPREDYGSEVASSRNPYMSEFFEREVYPHLTPPEVKPVRPGKRVA